jgi:FkbM family methyltransferase
MREAVKDYIRSKPRVFDLLKSVKRHWNGASDQTYQWFDRFSRAHTQVRFVQIGAADGLRNDPIREFILRDGWRGAMIEPLPDVFELLKSNYAHRSRNLVLLNAAISQNAGNATFWTFKESFLAVLPREVRLEYLRKASFDKEHVKKFLRKGVSEDVLRRIDVPCMTVSQVVATYMQDGVDLLVIDAEGHEVEIIKSVEESTVRPEAIFFESHHLGVRGVELVRALERSGYSVLQLGGDSVATLRRPGG